MVIVSFFDIPGSFLGISTTMWIMELIFIIASITDKLDGYLARKNNQVTNFGKFLDPIADKILVVAAMILFVGMGRLPAWIPIIVIFREFAVSGYRLIAVQNNGKIKNRYTNDCNNFNVFNNTTLFCICYESKN